LRANDLSGEDSAGKGYSAPNSFASESSVKNIFKNIIRHLLAMPSLELARRWPTRFNLSAMRKLNGILLSAEQLTVIAATVKGKLPCNLLVFGLGNDSLFWLKLNRGGVTLFLEDNADWFQKITARSKMLSAFLVNYHTRRTDWKLLLESPALLDMALPDQVTHADWDIILVDAPNGWTEQDPGRMKSIYLSSRLIGDSGDVFVHDCNREIEDAYCNKFLRKENLRGELQAPVGFLRQYHIAINENP
jgi:hypothetical protein